MDHPATDQEIREAALQYVRKVSGYRKPSQVNALAFDKAVQRITEATRMLIDSIQPGHAVSDYVPEPESYR